MGAEGAIEVGVWPSGQQPLVFVSLHCALAASFDICKCNLQLNLDVVSNSSNLCCHAVPLPHFSLTLTPKRHSHQRGCHPAGQLE